MKLLNDSLYRLVHSLTATEKLQFKRHVKTKRSTENAAYLILFDLILKQKSYDTEILRNKMESTDANIADAKKYLYNVLIDFLIKGDEVEHHLIHQFNVLYKEARLLYKKGLFQESMSVLTEAKEIAYKYEYFNQLIEFIDFELLFIHILYREDYYKYIEKANHEKSIAIRNIDISHRYKCIYFKILHFGEKNSKEEKTVFLNQLELIIQSDEMVGPDISSFPFSAKLYYIRSLIVYYNFINSFENEYEQHDKLYKLWNEFPHMKEKYDAIYYTMLCAYINLRLVFKHFNGLSKLLEYLSASYLQKSSKKEEIVRKHVYFNLKCRLYMYMGNFTTSFKYATLTCELYSLEKNASSIFLLQRVFSYLQLSELHFISSNYQEANSCLNIIEEYYLKFSKTRMDVVSKFKIMKLLIKLAEGDCELFQKQYEANKIFIHRNKEADPRDIETIFMGFFKTIIWLDKPEILKKLKKFKNELIENKLHRIIENYIGFDFIAWIDSYTTKVPMEDIMSEKANKEYPEILSLDF